MNEEIYDKEVAPLLKQLAERFEKAGLSFVAVCEYEKGETGITTKVQQDANPILRMTGYASLTNGNVDALIRLLLEDGRRFGHGSIFLSILEKQIHQEH